MKKTIIEFENDILTQIKILSIKKKLTISRIVNEYCAEVLVNEKEMA